MELPVDYLVHQINNLIFFFLNYSSFYSEAEAMQAPKILVAWRSHK